LENPNISIHGAKIETPKKYLIDSTLITLIIKYRKKGKGQEE